MDDTQFEALLVKLERIANALENGSSNGNKSAPIRTSCGNCKYKRAVDKSEMKPTLAKTSKTPW